MFNEILQKRILNGLTATWIVNQEEIGIEYFLAHIIENKNVNIKKFLAKQIQKNFDMVIETYHETVMQLLAEIRELKNKEK